MPAPQQFTGEIDIRGRLPAVRNRPEFDAECKTMEDCVVICVRSDNNPEFWVDVTLKKATLQAWLHELDIVDMPIRDEVVE